METIVPSKKKELLYMKPFPIRTSESMIVWLFMLPALIPLTLFYVYPILQSVYISFTIGIILVLNTMWFGLRITTTY